MAKNQGFIKIILIILVALALAKFIFGFDILEFLQRDEIKEVWDYIWNLIVLVWENFIKGPIMAIWDWVRGFLD